MQIPIVSFYLHLWMFILVRVLKEILHEDQGDSVARSP